MTVFFFQTLKIVLPLPLVSMVFDLKSCDIFLLFILYTFIGKVLFFFHSFQDFFFSFHLIMMCFGIDFFFSCLGFAQLLESIETSFTEFGKFSAFIFYNTFSAQLSLSFPSGSLMTCVPDVLLESHKSLMPCSFFP